MPVSKTSLANAPPSRLEVFSGPGIGPSPCFPPLSIGEGWSAGRRPGSLAIGSLRPALRSAGLTRRASGTQVLEGVGVPWRAGLLRGSPGASRRSIAARVVGGRALRSHQASRSTTPKTRQGEKDCTPCVRTNQEQNRLAEIVPQQAAIAGNAAVRFEQAQAGPNAD